MINFFKNFISYKLKAKSCKLNGGMTYVELIVVLSIFAVLSTVVILNYGSFQAKVDLKNLASDVALQIVQAQKSSLSGELPTQATASPWQPSYGVYFNTSGTVNGADSKNFIYFTDLDNNKIFDGSTCPTIGPAIVGECLSKYTIIKNTTSIYNLKVVYTNDSISTPSFTDLDNLTITFTRPDSGATIKSTTAFTAGLTVSYAKITVRPSTGSDVYIRVYPSGRIEID